MANVEVFIGPAPGASARAWVAAARRSMVTLRARPELQVPDDVLVAFDDYLARWSAAMEADEFRWSGIVDADVLRRLAAHWARLVTLAREVDGASGLLPADPAGEAFYEALATGMADALARADDGEAFAARFEDAVPDFDGVVGEAGATGAAAAPVRVLLVDDNPDIRLLVRIGLEATDGFAVVAEAADGHQAVEAVASARPDAILLDLAMPVMDGFEALPLLRDRCPAARIVVFSANDSAAARARVADAGGDAFLRKDAPIAAVVAALRPGG